MQPIPTLLTGALVALSVQSSTALAQASINQEIAFGGGSHFDFIVPVHAQGDLRVEVVLPSGVPVEAFLFSPRDRGAVVSTKGNGTVTLKYRIPYGIESWRGDEEWLVNVLLPTAYAEAAGTLRVDWPGDPQAPSTVVWRNAGPTDQAEQAEIAKHLRTMEARATSSGTDGTTLRIIKVLQARLNALAGTPAGSVRNDYAMAPVMPDAVGLYGASGPLSVSMTRLDCFRETMWHAEHGADQPYLVAAVLPEPGQRAVGGQTRVHRLVHDDQGRRASRGTPLTIVHPDGEPVFAHLESAQRSEVLIALLEREHAGPQGGLQAFLNAAEFFAMYREVAGPDAVRQLEWLVEVALCCGDALIGSPRLLTVERGLQEPTEVERILQFEGQDGQYAAVVVLTSARRDP